MMDRAGLPVAVVDVTFVHFLLEGGDTFTGWGGFDRLS